MNWSYIFSTGSRQAPRERTARRGPAHHGGGPGPEMGSIVIPTFCIVLTAIVFAGGFVHFLMTSE